MTCAVAHDMREGGRARSERDASVSAGAGRRRTRPVLLLANLRSLRAEAASPAFVRSQYFGSGAAVGVIAAHAPSRSMAALWLGNAEHGVLGGDSRKLAQGRSLIDRYVRAGAWRQL